MHDFGRLVYLEMQKSGSTFVNRFLSYCCTLTEIKRNKHAAVTNDYDPNSFYFITIRHPLALYSSLYRFGLDQRGGLYQRLKKAQKTSCYSNFEAFVVFMLDPQNAPFLTAGYNIKIAEQIGFMSFRFMKLSLQFPNRKILNCLASGNNLIELEREFITDLEIKNEDLIQGLKVLSTEIIPEHFEEKSVIKFLNNSPKINASKTRAEDLVPLSNPTLSKLHTQEALLLSRY